MPMNATVAILPLLLVNAGFFSNLEPALAVDARAESRARPAGQVEPDRFASGEIEFIPGVLAGIRHPSMGLVLRYAPSVTWTTYDEMRDPLILHQGMARLFVDLGDSVRLVGAHIRQHGERNFAAAIVHEEDGGRLRLEFLPDIDRIAIDGHFSRLGAVWEPTHRQEYSVFGGYSSFGGRGEWARRRLPKQTGPWGSLEADIGVSSRNAIVASTRASHTTFEPGPTFLIWEADTGVRRQWDRNTEVTGLVGVFTGFNEQPVGDELRSVILPTLRGELTRLYGLGRQEAELEVVVSARPGINQLYARLDPRVTAEGFLDWSWRDRIGASLEAGRAWVFDEGISLGGRILVTGGGLTVPLTTDWDLQGGMRIFRQSVRFGQDNWTRGYWRWNVYFALSFNSELFPRP